MYINEAIIVLRKNSKKLGVGSYNYQFLTWNKNQNIQFIYLKIE